MKSINLTYILLNYKISAQPCPGTDLLAGLENEIDVPVNYLILANHSRIVIYITHMRISAFFHCTGQPGRSPT